MWELITCGKAGCDKSHSHSDAVCLPVFAQLQDKQVTWTQALPAAAGLQEFPLSLSLCGKERIGVLRLSSASPVVG